MADPDRLSLDQLAALADVAPRQVRELVRLNILPAPSSRGRGAFYGTEHLDRLKAWKRLKLESPAGTTNEQLRVLVDHLQHVGLLKGVAAGSVPLALVDDKRQVIRVRGPGGEVNLGFAQAAPAPQVNEDALHYLQGMRAAPARLSVAPASLPMIQLDLNAGSRSAASVPLQKLEEALSAYVATSAAPLRAKPVQTETWERMRIGRDLEIAARGPLAPHERQLLETVGQLLQRAIYRKEA